MGVFRVYFAVRWVKYALYCGAKYLVTHKTDAQDARTISGANTEIDQRSTQIPPPPSPAPPRPARPVPAPHPPGFQPGVAHGT